jgi:RHS repeat-associated protein
MEPSRHLQPSQPSQSLGVSEPAQNYSQGGNISMGLTANYTYDNEGRITATQYPSAWNGSSWVSGPNLGNTFDGMGRLQKLTDLTASSDIIANATYAPTGQLLTMTGASGAPNETRTYNSIGQMTRLQSGSLDIQYAYPATQNNGKISSQYDNVSGEQITYMYDSLNRLASATGSGWGQSYNYDGFGNLTDQNVTSGTAPALHVTYDPATNRQTAECADANGNLCGSYYSYDVENRFVRKGAPWSGTPDVAYSYRPGNKRVWKGANYVYNDQTNWSLPSTDEVTFWSITGQKLATYNLSQYQPGGYYTLPQLVATQTGANYYFGGKLVKNSTGYVTPDRLGSIGKYFPYGQERPSATTDGKEKFATYFRDAETGLDYAKNRYEQPGMGRFITADRYANSAGAGDPGGWNRYAYTGGDPVNRTDPNGLAFCIPGADCNDEETYCEVYAQMDPAACDPLYDLVVGMPNPQTVLKVSPIQGLTYGQYVNFVQNLTNAVTTALDALRSNGDCAALFGKTPGTPDPYDVLFDINYDKGYAQFITDNLQPYKDPADPTRTLIDNAKTQPVASSANYGTLPDGTRVFQGTWNAATITINTNPLASFDAVTILHELGHVYTDLFGASSTSILDDNSSPGQSKANSDLIRSTCFK